MLMIIFVTKTNFIEIGNELVKIYVSTKDEEETFQKNTKSGIFPLVFSSFFGRQRQKLFFEKMA